MYKYNSLDNIYEPESAYDFGYKDSSAAEERIYKLISESSDRSLHSPELRTGAKDWPTYYHLTPLRANIVRPFRDLVARSSVLELGAGCGAITRYLGEQGGQVAALEGSNSRARVIGARCRDLPNVKVYCDLIQNLQLTEQFDIVTLIGVLEYSRVYVEADDPVDAVLRQARGFLKPGGVLLVAIENQLGLKYFAGYPEDHMGRAMFGINDSYDRDTPVTFGRRELVSRILRAGFQSTAVYLPFPDYKTPVSVIYPAGHAIESAPADWNLGTIAAGSVVHDRQRIASPTFSQEMAWQVVARNGLAADLANSLLIVCSDAGQCLIPGHENQLASHYGGDRPLEFGKETQFFNVDGHVSARTLSNAKNSGVWENEIYETGTVWFDELLRLVNRPNWKLDDIVNWARPWMAALEQIAADSDGVVKEPAFAHFSRHLPGKFIDATPTNWIVRPDGSHGFIDLEWEVPFALPLEFILFRGLFLTVHRVTNCARPAANTPVNIGALTLQALEQLGVHISADDMDNFLTVFNSFQNIAVGLPEDALNGLTAAIEKATLPIRQL